VNIEITEQGCWL